MRALGLEVTQANIKISSRNLLVAWEYVRLGFGLGVGADEIAARCPEIVPAFEDVAAVSFPIWLVTHRELHTSLRIRTVFDHLAEGMRAAASSAAC